MCESIFERFEMTKWFWKELGVNQVFVWALVLKSGLAWKGFCFENDLILIKIFILGKRLVLVFWLFNKSSQLTNEKENQIIIEITYNQGMGVYFVTWGMMKQIKRKLT